MLGDFFCFVLLCLAFVCGSLGTEGSRCTSPSQNQSRRPEFHAEDLQFSELKGVTFRACGGGGVSEATGFVPPSCGDGSVPPSTRIIKRAGTELNLCRAHRAGGSSQALPQPLSGWDHSSSGERKGGAQRTPQESPEPPGASAPRRWTTPAGPGRCGCGCCCCCWRCCLRSGDKICQWKNAVTRVLNGQIKTGYVLLCR